MVFLVQVTNRAARATGRHDYLPFGEELSGGTDGRTSLWGVSDSVHQKFTGQERDSETQLDYFIARYYGAALGRFTSPDPANAGADPTNPQSWNGYAYVGNNPLALVDPTGLDPIGTGNGCTWDPGTNTLNCAGTFYNGCVAEGTQGCLPPPCWMTKTGCVGSLPSGIGGGGATSVGHGGSQAAPGSNPQLPAKSVAQKFACAANFGQSHSIGSLFGGGPVANFLGGNTVSSIVNASLAAIGNGPAPDPKRTYRNGPAFGVPINDIRRFANKPPIDGIGSVSGFVRGNALQGLFKAATAPGTITSIAQGGEVALQGGITAAQYASGAALLKFGWDTVTVGYGYFYAAECQ